MPREFGSAGPVVHSLLFAVYHLDSPWMIPVRTVGILPMIYVTIRSRSVKPGIVAHCTVNGLDLLEKARARLG